MASVLPDTSDAGGTSNVQVMDLREGMKGGLVFALQEDLKKFGFDPGRIDGVFGPKTRAAVEALQRKLGIPATGMIDAATRAAISADLQSSTSVLKQNAVVLRLPTPTSTTVEASTNDTAAAAAAAATAPKPFYTQPAFLVLLGVGILAFWWFSSSNDYAVGTVDDLNAFVGGDDNDDDDDAPPPKRRRRAGKSVSTLK